MRRKISVVDISLTAEGVGLPFSEKNREVTFTQ